VVGMRPTNLRRSANKIRSDVRIAAAPPKALYRKITGASRNSVAKR
jgi:type IV secretion system protein VirB6